MLLRKAGVGKSSALLNDMYVCLIGIFLKKFIYIKANLLKIQIPIDELQVKWSILTVFLVQDTHVVGMHRHYSL